MAGAATPRVFSIPAGRPFLACLAEATLAGQLAGMAGPPTLLELPKITLLLPTRRACKAMQEAFLSASGGRALLLPRIRPIGDVDEDESLLTAGDFDLPPAMDGIERHLILTSLVLKWIKQRRVALAATHDTGAPAGAQTPAQASALARGLAQLMDMVETEGADLSKLAELAPAMFSEQWRQTVEFLSILSAVWPAILAASGKLSPADRRNRLLALQAQLWTDKPPKHAVIVAGVTGSIPATARLMQVVAALPKGAVVLAGLDHGLDDATWAEVYPASPSHPQFRLATLLARWGVARSAVKPLGVPPSERQRVIGEALRPAASTAAWGEIGARLDASTVAAALSGIVRLDAASPEDEAEAVALILRRAADSPATTAALVTPDRTLARRVAVRLTSWGISIDDSAGRPLSKTPPGVLFDLTATVLAMDFAPAPLMALLKHPLTRLGLTVAEVRRGARMLELRALRRPNLGAGLDSLRTLLADAGNTPDPDDHEPHHRAISGMSDRDGALARSVLEALAAALAPLRQLFEAGGQHPLATLIDAHIATVELIATDETGATDALWAEPAGEAASAYLASLVAAGANALAIAPAAYPELYRSLIATETVRAARTSHPNLTILGPFEARLLQPDIVILGGLNDGVAPEIAEPDPWLNRPMLAALGLPQPETRIGDAAHDFVQLLSVQTVYLTRAVKRDGAPTVASRWLLRLDAVLAGLGLKNTFAGDAAEPWLAWAQNQKALTDFAPRPAPAPRPPLVARPRQLSVTRIEHWMANPYAIFAREILRLELMPELGGAPEASVRGRIIHQALHRFAARHPDALPADITAALLAEAEAGLTRLAAHPRVAAFWRPRFARFADWFAGSEPTRRTGIARTVSEISGAIGLAAPGGPFRLTARADRIDMLQGGGVLITDYKTGAVPNDARVTTGLSPQLPLEAAIAAEGGFAGIAASPVSLLRFIAATGGEPPGLEHAVKCDDVTVLAAETLAGLTRLIARFDDPSTPYTSLRRPGFRDSARYDDYAHLARVKEWSLLAEAGNDE